VPAEKWSAKFGDVGRGICAAGANHPNELKVATHDFWQIPPLVQVFETVFFDSGAVELDFYSEPDPRLLVTAQKMLRTWCAKPNRLGESWRPAHARLSASQMSLQEFRVHF
jgi:hypothetical protein